MHFKYTSQIICISITTTLVLPMHLTPSDGNGGYNGIGTYLLSSCGSHNKPFGTTE